MGTPQHTIAWGHSLGGIITAGLIQTYPDRFSAALPMCGVLAGGVATWNAALDGAFAFQQLADPAVQVTGITNPLANLQGAESAIAAAQATPAGRARIALGAALGDTPGWFTPLSAEPAANDFAGQEANQFQWDANVDFPFIFAFRAELEARAGGNPSWNTGVDYAHQLAISADRSEVRALYKAAGLSLRADLRKLNKAARISADPNAVRYLARNISFTGRITIPVLSMHTTGDGLVIPQNEQAYASVVRKAGRVVPAPPGVREPGRALRVHPGRDHHRRPAAAAPDADRPLAGRDVDSGRHEHRGRSSRPELQHLQQWRQGCPGRPGVHAVPADPLPAPVRPGLPLPPLSPIHIATGAPRCR